MTDTFNPNLSAKDAALIETAIRHGATRRELLKMMAVGGLALSTGGLLLGRATAALADTPKKGGSIKLAAFASSTSDTLDPARASNSTDYVRMCMFYNRLVDLDQNLSPVMDLAESVESDDGKSWTIKLRKGVQFHDGKSLSSADVVYTFKRHLDPNVGSKVNLLAKQMEEIRAEDDQTVRIVLTEANGDLPVILGMYQFMIIADGTTDFATANGTGPFLCDYFKPGDKAVARRNPNYWRPSLPHLDEVTHFAISDDSARLNALMSGDIDIAANVNPQQLDIIRNNPDLTLRIAQSGGYSNLNMRLDMPPGNSPDFVTGMKYLMNREMIEKGVMRGMAQIANDQPISPTDRYHNADLKPLAFDPDKAKHHFEKAGVIGSSIPLICSSAATASVEMATVLQQAGASIGMNFSIENKPAAGYWSDYWLKSPVHFGNINMRPTPDIIFSLFYASNAAWNESRFKSENFDNMLREARGLVDFNKRKEIYDEMQVMVAGQAGTAIPVYMSNADAYLNKIKGMGDNPLGGLMGYDCAQHIWIDG